MKRLRVVAALAAIFTLLFAGQANATVAATWTWTNVKSHLCLGVSGGHIFEGAKVIQWTCSGAADQGWFDIPLPMEPNEGVLIKNTVIGAGGYHYCLTSPNRVEGAQLVVTGCNEYFPPEQTWHVQWVTNKGYLFTNRKTGWAMAVTGGSTTRGAAIIQWRSNGGLEQHWT